MRITISDAEAGKRLDKLVVDTVPGIGRAGAKRLFDEGKVRVFASGGERGRRAAKGDVGALGDVIDIAIERDATTDAQPDPAAPLEVVLERDDVLVLEKPAGQPTAPLRPGERGSLVNAMIARYPEIHGFGFSPREPGICHRLDTDTSGLLLAARTAPAFETMTRALKEGRLDKRYLLICAAADLPESGTIEIPLAPHPKDRRRVYPCMHPRDVARYAPRPASTSYRVLGIREPWALVEARAPKAMRHQIRAHFAAIDHPLAGDVLYGGTRVEGIDRHALHAHFILWSGDRDVPAFTVRSLLPPDIAALVPEPVADGER